MFSMASGAVSALAESFAEVQVTADSVGKSAILTVKTSQDTTVQTFSIWLDSGDFRSYKTGNDWATSLNPAGILTFAAPSPLESGASVQFGMTADTGNFKINWNAFDANGALVGSGVIIADNPSETTKSEYIPGSDILVLGNVDTNTPILIDLSLLDPNGVVIKSKEMFSGGIDTKGKISDDTFRVPTDAILGTWTLKAQSGATNVGTTEFQVIEAMDSGARILVNVLDSGTLEIRGENVPDLGRISLAIYTIDDEELDTFDSLVQAGVFVESWTWLDGSLKPGTCLVMTV